MNEIDYLSYVLDSKKADELHSLIDKIAAEEGLVVTHPYTMISPRAMHMYAYVNGLITPEEYYLLCRFF